MTISLRRAMLESVQRPDQRMAAAVSAGTAGSTKDTVHWSVPAGS